MSSNIRTRFLLLSDTHARAPAPSTTIGLPYRWPLPIADVAIHTGDLTMNGKISEQEEALELLVHLPADLKVVIPGNHDLTLDTEYYSRFAECHGPIPKYTSKQLQQIRDLYTGAKARASNIVYLEEGIQTFKLKNGASLTIYASAYSPEFFKWAFAYERDQDRYNSPNADHPVPSHGRSIAATTNIDVMLTHGPPMGILDKVNNKLSRDANLHVGCEHLYRAAARARPLLHCFGHIHEGWGALRKTWPTERQSPAESLTEEASANCVEVQVDREKVVREMGAHVDGTGLRKGEETLFVNSSIMDLQYRPVQGPWVVDLMLDRHV